MALSDGFRGFPYQAKPTSMAGTGGALAAALTAWRCFLFTSGLMAMIGEVEVAGNLWHFLILIFHICLLLGVWGLLSWLWASSAHSQGLCLAARNGSVSEHWALACGTHGSYRLLWGDLDSKSSSMSSPSTHSSYSALQALPTLFLSQGGAPVSSDEALPSACLCCLLSLQRALP